MKNGESEVPIAAKERRRNPRELALEREHEKELLKQDLIESSKSEYRFPVVLVDKKDGKKRVVVDYRKLNEHMKKFEFPLPIVDDILDSLHGSIIFSSLDLLSGYWQIPLREGDKEKTAFSIAGNLRQWKVLPQGLKSSPAIFSHLLDIVLSGLKWHFVLVYIDDVIIFSKSFNEHLDHLDKIFKRLSKANLMLSLKKCQFAFIKLKYLGHVAGKNGLEPDPDKVKAITEFPQPRTIRNVREFLGMVGYYRRFIKEFSKIAKPMLNLLKQDGYRRPIVERWDDECARCFEELKEQMRRAPILAFPDFRRPFTLTGAGWENWWSWG